MFFYPKKLKSNNNDPIKCFYTFLFNLFLLAVGPKSLKKFLWFFLIETMTPKTKFRNYLTFTLCNVSGSRKKDKRKLELGFSQKKDRFKISTEDSRV